MWEPLSSATSGGRQGIAAEDGGSHSPIDLGLLV